MRVQLQSATVAVARDEAQVAIMSSMYERVRCIAPKPSDVEGTSERKAEYVRDRLAHIERHMQVRATRRRTVANIKYYKRCEEVTIPGSPTIPGSSATCAKKAKDE